MSDSVLGLAAQLIVIALLWGGTNPLIKNNTKGIERVRCSNGGLITRFLKEIAFLFLNWKYLVFFGLNQLGSVLFFVILQKHDLNIIVPVTNSLSYAFTYLVSYLIGESEPNKRTIPGLVLIIAGTTCLVMSKDVCSGSKCDTV